MTLPWDLEDWLTDAGDRVVRKLASSPEAVLTDRERLIHEIWLLDTEARNGGLSQYFCNWGVEQWNECGTLASSGALPSFAAFADRVTALLPRDTDPYLAVLNADGDDLWYDYQEAVVSELRSFAGNGPRIVVRS
jgi:hypothetical protein